MTEDPFEEALQRGAREIRKQRGVCPDAAALLRYASGDRSDFQLIGHIERCGSCDAFVSRLSASVPWWKGPTPAYVLCALLAAGWLLTEDGPRAIVQTAASPALALQSPVYLDLNADRSMAAPRETAGRLLLVQFTIPYDASRRYTAALRTADGREVAQYAQVVSYDSLGNCRLLLSGAGLAAGIYRLTIDDGEGNEYHFEFRLA